MFGETEVIETFSFSSLLQFMKSSCVGVMVFFFFFFLFLQALLGRFLFGEVLSLKWWCGASLIVIGLLLIHRGSSKAEHAEPERKKDR